MSSVTVRRNGLPHLDNAPPIAVGIAATTSVLERHGRPVINAVRRKNAERRYRPRTPPCPACRPIGATRCLCCRLRIGPRECSSAIAMSSLHRRGSVVVADRRPTLS